MPQKSLTAILLTCVLAFCLSPGVVQAHQTVPVGAYTLEYGWLTEPPIAGQGNAFVVNINKGESPASEAEISGLKVEVVYGSESKFLELQPLGENTPGQMVAPVLPTRPGTYTLRFSGTLGGADRNAA